jgi:hypothetical protein
MATLEELVVKPGDLRNVRLADHLGKRNSAFPHGWNLRYTVLSGNFLYIFVTHQVSSNLPLFQKGESRETTK